MLQNSRIINEHDPVYEIKKRNWNYTNIKQARSKKKFS